MIFPFTRDVKEVSCVLCGAAGLGIQTVEDMLARIVVDSGFSVFGSREYMSRVRGGNNSTELRIAQSRVDALVDRIDILLVLSRNVRTNIRERIGKSTVIIGDTEELKGEFDESCGILCMRLCPTLPPKRGAYLLEFRCGGHSAWNSWIENREG